MYHCQPFARFSGLKRFTETNPPSTRDNRQSRVLSYMRLTVARAIHADESPQDRRCLVALRHAAQHVTIDLHPVESEPVERGKA
jgi:hypothetical protein